MRCEIVLESLLRNCGDGFTTPADVAAVAAWTPATAGQREIQLKPGRVLLQDFTGVPAVVDLAAMRDALQRLGGDPALINPLVPADLIIDHSVQVDLAGRPDALLFNEAREFERNRERYEFLRWGQQAFDQFRVVPPSQGIIHQVNLECLASVVMTADSDAGTVVYPDSVVGTDSHTTMINGLGVLGWGVGGIEAEAVLLGQPLALVTPAVVGVRLVGALPAGATATDLVLTLTALLRRHGVVGTFVEFYGPGLAQLPLADRATLANMAPEYGATCGYFPVDDETLRYLRITGRPTELIALVEAYYRAQGLFRTVASPEPIYSATVTLDLATIEPSLAGPRRPQDRIRLGDLKRSFWETATAGAAATARSAQRWATDGGDAGEADALPAVARQSLYADAAQTVVVNGQPVTLTHGAVVLAAITSCTNTSNPGVMLAAGLVARNAVARGLTVPAHVKTSLAPGSQVVTAYLRAAGLLQPLEALRFHVVGYGCTTCIGNSGPIADEIAEAVREHDLVVGAVLSGNRNFEGRINPVVRANYLASPPLVVAYALAGTVDINLRREPLGHDAAGRPVYLADLWPSPAEISAVLGAAEDAALFRAAYRNVFTGSAPWQAVPVTAGPVFAWDRASTYIQHPPYFAGMTLAVPAPQPITGARILALLGDSVTTDHISPAGSIAADSAAGRYLAAQGVAAEDFNSYGTRRGNHEVMVRGTFANPRLRNFVVDEAGSLSRHYPSGAVASIFETAMRYGEESTPLVVMAGREYGTGSSRDWAAKGSALLGVRAVIAQSYERIHRSNLVGMGVLPLQFATGESWQALGLRGDEVISIELPADVQPGQTVTVSARRPDGTALRFAAVVRIESQAELRYYQHGGILHYVLRTLAAQPSAVAA